MIILLHILNGILIAFESMLLMLFASKVISRKLHPVLIFLALFGLQLLVYLAAREQVWGFAAFFILDALVLLLCYQGEIGKKLFVIFFFYASISISDMTAFLLSHYACKIMQIPIESIYELQYPASFISRLLTLLIVYFFRKSVRADNLKDWMKFLPIPCVTAIVLTWVFPFDGAESEAMRLLALICLFGFVSNAVLFGFIQKSAEKKKLQYRLSTSEEFKEMQSIYFRDLQATYKYQESLIHNIKQHFDYIMSAPDYETIIKYVKEIEKRVFSRKTRFTRNIEIDTILNSKYHDMQEKGIALNVNVALPQHIDWLDPVDLSIILGNGLSNAIEACERCHGKEITVEVRYDEWLLLSIENPTDHKPIQKKYGAGFMSAKGERHGIGMVCMETAVERYDGHMEYRADNDVFRLDVMLQPYRRNDV